MPNSTSIPIIVQGNSFSLAIPLQIYVISEGSMVLQDYTPDPTDQVSIQLKGSRRQYTYAPTIQGNTAFIDLSGNEMADNYGVVVSIVKADGTRLRSFRTDQFFIVESSDDLTPDDIIQGLEENVIYLNSSIFVAGEDGRGIESITKTGASGLVDTYTITYTDATTSTFTVTNGAQGEAGATIASVTKTATAGKVDTYTITMTDGNTFNFEVTNGLDGVDLGLANIVNDLTTGGSTNVLSAEMGKVLGEGVFEIESGTSETIIPTLEQGTIIAATGQDALPSSSTYARRVRIVGYIQVAGNFSVSATSGHELSIYYYDSNHTYISSTEWQEQPFSGNFTGYIRAAFRTDQDTSLTPSDISVSVTITSSQTTMRRRIEDTLTSERTDMALSANQGKYIGGILLGDNGTLIEFEQGSLNGSTGEEYPSSDTNYYKRVRSDFIEVGGKFSFALNSGACYNVFLYDSDKTFIGKAIESLTEGTFYEGNWVGFIKILLSNADKTTTCEPSDFTLTLTLDGLLSRVDALEQQVVVPSSFENGYVGELIKIGYNKFKRTPYKVLPRALSQAMAIYDDYILLFTYATSSATAYLYKLSDGTLLATLSLPNSIYKRPHCNAATFGNVFNSADSILPLLYVSQWDNDSEKGCFVYDITLSGGNYAVNLVQMILPTNVDTATRGAGQTDWVVDPMGYIYSIGYLLNDGAHTLPNNKTMIAKYALPKVSDGSVITFGDADVLDHFDIPIFIYRQDLCFENGRILMLAGNTGAIDRRLLSINPDAQKIASLVSLDYINKEPEGIGVTDGKLLIGFNGDATLYNFQFG